MSLCRDFIIWVLADLFVVVVTLSEESVEALSGTIIAGVIAAMEGANPNLTLTVFVDDALIIFPQRNLIGKLLSLVVLLVLLLQHRSQMVYLLCPKIP